MCIVKETSSLIHFTFLVIRTLTRLERSFFHVFDFFFEHFFFTRFLSSLKQAKKLAEKQKLRQNTLKMSHEPYGQHLNTEKIINPWILQ